MFISDDSDYRSLTQNVLSVIMDIFEMDHFREPEVEEVQLFLESTGTHGSIVDELLWIWTAVHPPKYRQGKVYCSISMNLFSPLSNTYP